MDAYSRALNLLHQMQGPQAEFRPGQWEAIQNLLLDKHTLVVMPTGSGKSLIYQLAALLLAEKKRPSPTALVISPLIALMKDQVDNLERRGIPATFIISYNSSSCLFYTLIGGRRANQKKPGKSSSGPRRRIEPRSIGSGENFQPGQNPRNTLSARRWKKSTRSLLNTIG